MKVGIYARLSQDRTGEQTATARQIADCRRLCELKEWQVAEPPYEDVDLSAYKEVARPEFERLLSDLDNGVIHGVVCWKVDRLVRSPREFERVFQILERSHATLASVHEQFD